MTTKTFESWFKKLKDIWEQKRPNEILNICADNFAWYETSFDKPYTSKEKLLNDWQGILNQDNIKVDIKVLAVNNDLGIANWKASFKRLPSNEKVVLDGIFAVRLNKEERCTEFRQWRSIK